MIVIKYVMITMKKKLRILNILKIGTNVKMILETVQPLKKDVIGLKTVVLLQKQ